MFWFALKIIVCMAVAAFLLFMAWRLMRGTRTKPSPIQSLPGNLVQEIADRMEDRTALLAFLSDFFETPYYGNEHEFTEKTKLVEFFVPFEIPEEVLQKLIRVAGAIERDALLAYSLKTPRREGVDSASSAEKPLIVTICRKSEGPGILVGIFSTEKDLVS